MHKIIAHGVNPLRLMDELTSSGISVNMSFPEQSEANDTDYYNDVEISIIDSDGIDVEKIRADIEGIIALHDPSIPQDIPLDEQEITAQRIADLELMIIELLSGGGM